MCALKYSDESFGGKRFVLWSVIKRVKLDEPKNDYWLCRCDCGTKKIVLGKSLRLGTSRSCGCLRDEENSKRYSANLVGKQYGWIEVLERAPKKRKNSSYAYWRCKCHRCGKVFVTSSQCIAYWKIKSCGCEGADLASERAKNRCGPLHSMWKLELTDEDRLPRNDKRLRQWRTSLFERDDYTCCVTGKRGGKLSAHHLDSWDKHPDKRFDADNGVSVLWRVHTLFHSLYGRGENEKEQWLVFCRQAQLGEFAAL